MKGCCYIRNLESETKLIFRTPLGSQTIPAGTSVNLTNAFRFGLPVAEFPAIRIVAASRNASASNITVSLVVTIPTREGPELFATLDQFTLGPGQTVSRVYEVPGTNLTINAFSDGSVGESYLDLAVYGYKPFNPHQDYC